MLDTTHHELHRQAIEFGLREPTMVGGIDLDEVTAVDELGWGPNDF